MTKRGLKSQTCPSCGTTELEGAYCTRCLRPTGNAAPLSVSRTLADDADDGDDADDADDGDDGDDGSGL